ncbi:alpha/beta hydrolase [Spiroplasma endosymbiont of Crioceris asparagi]|uniref:alpha/beta hydrolase n=1 Tax=Spiroplasma endosymbiont of Crioceris asparagi TaxID=3066286 RepID=UPI0030D1AE05
MKKNKKNLINTTRNSLKLFYGSLENYFSVRGVLKRQLEEFNDDNATYKQIIKFNNIMLKFYKRKELIIEDIENLKDVVFETQDGKKLKGLFYIPNRDSNKWLIACHWFSGHKYWALYHAKVFAKMGYNIFVFDFRGHGESQEATSTLGLTESFDLLAAIKFVNEKYSVDEIALMGTSVGAFIVNFASIKYNQFFLENNVKLIVSDSAFTNIETVLAFFTKKLIWVVPKTKRKELVNKFVESQNKMLKSEGYENLDFYEMNIMKLITKQKDLKLIPTLFIHSKDDKQTPTSDTYDLAIARKKFDSEIRDEILNFNHAMHTQAIKTHFKIYNNKIADFIVEEAKHNKSKELENIIKLYNKLISEWKLDDLNVEDKRDKKSLSLY